LKIKHINSDLDKKQRLLRPLIIDSNENQALKVDKEKTFRSSANSSR